MKDTRFYRDVVCGTDHNLVITTERLCLHGIVANTINARRHDTAKLKIPELRGTFLKKLWCCVSGKYNEIIGFYQLA